MRKALRASVCGWLAAAAAAALPLASPVFADPAPASGPAPVQVVPDAPPAALPPGKVLVLPFTADNPADPRAWVGKSIQQSLVADLTVSSPDRVLSNQQTAAGAEDAAALGRRMGARYVVIGSFASSNQDLRITGQVIDATTGQAVAGLKVTGSPDDIFHLEDGLALQLKSRVMPDVLRRQEQAAAQSSLPTQPAPGQTTGVQADVTGSASPANTYYSTYAYPYTNYPAEDYNRYYYTTPPVYYYGGPGYCDYGLWNYPYVYQPFFGVGFGIGYGYGYGFGHGHFDHGGYYHHDHDGDGHGGVHWAHGATGTGHVTITGTGNSVYAHSGGRSIAGPSVQTFNWNGVRSSGFTRARGTTPFEEHGTEGFENAGAFAGSRDFGAMPGNFAAHASPSFSMPQHYAAPAGASHGGFGGGGARMSAGGGGAAAAAHGGGGHR